MRGCLWQRISLLTFPWFLSEGACWSFLVKWSYGENECWVFCDRMRISCSSRVAAVEGESRTGHRADGRFMQRQAGDAGAGASKCWHHICGSTTGRGKRSELIRGSLKGHRSWKCTNILETQIAGVNERAAGIISGLNGLKDWGRFNRSFPRIDTQGGH